VSLEQALAFLVFSTVAAITPGPSNVMVTVIGAIAGIVRGLPCLFGVGAGMALMMFVVAFGLGTVVLGRPVLVAVLRWCGAAFLLWLAWKIATAPPNDRPYEGRPVGFLGGFAFQWLNPKAWLVSTSAFGASLRTDAGVLIQALAMAGLLFAVAFACGFVWLAFGVAVRQMLASPGLQRTFNMAMGALLALSVLLFVW
jgi:threonine/homoserine/homoserine lactone efflux protein